MSGLWSGIQLLPGIQRHGIGTAIIEDLKVQATAAGLLLELDVEQDNPDARKLYERLGFVQVGETAQEYKLRWSPPPGWLLGSGAGVRWLCAR